MATSSRTGHVVIVGAGVGGLTAAVALYQRGWQLTVLEQADRLAPVGSGIALFPNALRALDAIGVGAQLRSGGQSEFGVGIRRPSGRWLSRANDSAAVRRHGPSVLAHRADLIDLLHRAVPAGAVVTGTRVAGDAITTGGSGPATVRYPGGTITADLVVAADGVHSLQRSRLFPGCPGPRYAGYTTWRLVVPLDLGPDGAAGAETWGRGQRFGSARLPDKRTYCYASATTDAGQHADDSELAEVRARFGDWHDPIPALLAAATPDTVVRTDVYEQRIPLPSYVTGRVALLGDAAHAMAPDLGQGGGQAMEDAVTLAATLTDHSSVPAALARYDELRRPRTQRVVRLAHRIGTAAHLRNRFAVAGRDAILATVPPAAGAHLLNPILDWTPPPPPDTRST
ncbi:MAG TPA: FAD-dependent monooxygenase [Streptosporangiaceae bacterium]|nr:FAD-dependent monooxygenase [Streptosporangiaceae bacterium]